MIRGIDDHFLGNVVPARMAASASAKALALLRADFPKLARSVPLPRHPSMYVDDSVSPRMSILAAESSKNRSCAGTPIALPHDHGFMSGLRKPMEDRNIRQMAEHAPADEMLTWAGLVLENAQSGNAALRRPAAARFRHLAGEDCVPAFRELRVGEVEPSDWRRLAKNAASSIRPVS
jgi:hypothetical protein